MALSRCPDFGTKCISLTVKLRPSKSQPEALGASIQDMYRSGQFSDIVISCCEKQFPAHQVVLAAQSPVLRQQLQQMPSNSELRLNDCSNPEAAKFMLDFMYEVDDSEWAEYNPRTQEINKDVLRLSKSFALEGLQERAVRWLAKDLTTGNVVERLQICEEFELGDLRDKILEQLTNNRQALAEVANSPQIMTYPKLMQAMLQCAANAGPEEKDRNPQPKKKGRKA